MTLETRPQPRDVQGGDTQHPRKRRGKYTRIACGSCKTRKVKCSGTVPCGRCVELNAKCIYPEFPIRNGARHEAISRKSVNEAPPAANKQDDTHSQDSSLALDNARDHRPTSHSYLSAPSRPSLNRRRRSNNFDIVFTSATYLTNFVQSLNLARTVLEERGVLSDEDLELNDTDVAQSRPFDSSDQGQQLSSAALEAARPVVEIGYEPCLDLFQTFMNEIYPSYPCIDPGMTRRTLDTLFGLTSDSPEKLKQEPLVEAIDVEIAKAVIAIGLLVQHDETSLLARDLHSQLVWHVDSSIEKDHTQVEDIVMAALSAIYFVIKIQYVKAYRLVGFATRIAIELGMHCERFHRGHDGDYAPDCMSLRGLFAAIFNLDRHCSFMASLPCNLNKRIVEEGVLDLHGEFPYLSAMIKLDGVGAEMFELVNKSSSGPISDLTADRISQLEDQTRRVDQESHKRDILSFKRPVRLSPKSKIVLEVVWDMRVVAIQMLAQFRGLRSVESLLRQGRMVQLLITSATTLIDLYAKAAQASLPARIHPLWYPFMSHLLMASISCMFLAVSCSPTIYGPICRGPFHRAIDFLLQCPSPRSEMQQKAWCSLNDLKRIAERLHMPPPDPSSSADIDIIFGRTAEADVGMDEFGTMTETDQFPMLGTEGGDVPMAIWTYDQMSLDHGYPVHIDFTSAFL